MSGQHFVLKKPNQTKLPILPNHHCLVDNSVARAVKSLYYIRKSAIRYNIPYMTTLTAALAGVKGIAEKAACAEESLYSLQEYHLKKK